MAKLQDSKQISDSLHLYFGIEIHRRLKYYKLKLHYILSKRSIFVLISFLGLGISGCRDRAPKNPAPVRQASFEAIKIDPARKNILYQQVEAFYDSALAKTFSGAFLVAQHGEIIFEKYQGTVTIPGTELINENTPFHLASVSKTFTAMAALRLWEQGKIGLNDTLGKYFPGFPYRGITIKMLLNHRSGLPNYTHYFDQMRWNKQQKVTNEDVLESLYTQRLNLQFASGKHFGYCNTNYALLALLIEKVAQMKFGDYLKREFFVPLEMNHTYVFSRSDSAQLLPSYEYNNRPYPFDYLDLVYGDKNIYSTVRDLLKWDQALYGNKMFKKATLDSAFAPYSFEKPGIRNYGLGWRLQLPAGSPPIVYHNGWWHGNNTVFTRLVADTATIIVLGNKRNAAIYRVKPLFRFFPHYGAGAIEEDM
jgi:CubicO group peptidase (beta-lactamase class C family)